MAGQENAIEKAAELVLALAQETGEACGLPKGVAALRVLDSAWAMAVADAIGPNAPQDRVDHALRVLWEKISTMVPLQLILRHGRHV